MVKIYQNLYGSHYSGIARKLAIKSSQSFKADNRISFGTRDTYIEAAIRAQLQAEQKRMQEKYERLPAVFQLFDTGTGSVIGARRLRNLEETLQHNPVIQSNPDLFDVYKQVFIDKSSMPEFTEQEKKTGWTTRLDSK